MLYHDEALPPNDALRRPARRALVWAAAILLLVLCGIAVVAASRRDRPDPRLVFPRIQAAGGVLAIGLDAGRPSANTVHRVLVDVDDDALGREGINPQLKTAAKMLNLYAIAGVPPEKVHMVLLFYGRGVNVALSDATYARRFHRSNPDANLLAQLHRADVSMVVCGQALLHQTFSATDIRPGSRLALSALTEREELQAAGYGSVPKEVR